MRYASPRRPLACTALLFCQRAWLSDSADGEPTGEPPGTVSNVIKNAKVSPPFQPLSQFLTMALQLYHARCLGACLQWVQQKCLDRKSLIGELRNTSLHWAPQNMVSNSQYGPGAIAFEIAQVGLPATLRFWPSSPGGVSAPSSSFKTDTSLRQPLHIQPFCIEISRLFHHVFNPIPSARTRLSGGSDICNPNPNPTSVPLTCILCCHPFVGVPESCRYSENMPCSGQARAASAAPFC